MKIDKSNPQHWLALLRFAAVVGLGWLLRPFSRKQSLPLVLLYGHKLNGNLLSIYRALAEESAPRCRCVFLTLDHNYLGALRADGINAALASGWSGVRLIAEVQVIVSDHGLHMMSALPWLSRIKFADVWHGIPYKGWDKRDFIIHRRYDEIWVSSELIKRFYIEKFGFSAGRVQATGYGRVDRLINKTDNPRLIRKTLGIPESVKKIITFAPTWSHHGGSNNPLPFGIEPAKFFSELARVCDEHQAWCLFRTHLNTRFDAVPDEGPFSFIPSAEYADTEGVLLVSDVLVCDWSSIAFDFLVLERPCIFLDIPAPFPKGFTLGPEYRYGAIAPDYQAMITHINEFLQAPTRYTERYAERAQAIRRAAYDNNDDGRAAQRYLERLYRLLER